MSSIESIVAVVNDFVWGPIMLVLLVGTGVFLTIRLKFLPWRNLPYALRKVFSRQTDEQKGEGDITPFQSLMTALAATIGTGNIAGVATAMVSGGPGAVVWMWLSALFGLSTKYAESTLAVKYRVVNEEGQMAGGPMYTLERGLKIKWLGKTLGILFAIFTVLASFGIGNMTQANSIQTAISSTFHIDGWIIGIILIIVVGLVVIGGIKSIGRVCEIIVPFMAVLYLISGLVVIGLNFSHLGQGLVDIFRTAFAPSSVFGGLAGISVMSAIRYGVARGVFSNESGLGSAPIVAAAAKTDSPSEQGYINMTGTFFDTIIICSITALILASSGVVGSTDAAGELLSGADLTLLAFRNTLGYFGEIVVTVGLSLFAFSTILGWEYYGERALGYLYDNNILAYAYRIIFTLIVYVGATQTLDLVWNISDTFNGLMSIPNLISLLLLSNVLAKECFDYQEEVLIPERERRRIAKG